MALGNRNPSGYCKGTECDKGIYDLQKRKLGATLAATFSFSAWAVSVCPASFPAPPEDPTSLRVAPLLPVVLASSFSQQDSLFPNGSHFLSTVPPGSFCLSLITTRDTSFWFSL